MKKSALIFYFLFFSFVAKAQISEEQRAIIEAVKIGTLEQIQNLVKDARDANTKDQDDVPILMWAIYQQSEQAVSFLLKIGADPSIKAAINIGSKGYYGSCLAIASGEGKLGLVKRLIEDYRIPVDDREFNPDDQAETGWTALEWACSRNQEEIANYLLAKGADPNVNEVSPLKLAISQNNQRLVGQLLAKGAKPNSPTFSPLYYAVHYQRKALVDLLLTKGAKVDSYAKDQQTVFYYALERGFLEIAQLLLEKGASFQATFGDGAYPIHICAKNGYYELARLMLEKGADPNRKTKKLGLNPLMYAAYNNQLMIAKLLLEKGADKTLTDSEGQTALDFAKMRKDEEGNLQLPEMIKFLEEGIFTPLSPWEKLNQKVVMYYNARQYQAAITTAQEAAELQRKTKGDESLEYAQALLNLGRLLINAEKSETQLEPLRRCLAIFEKLEGNEGRSYQAAYKELGDAYLSAAHYPSLIAMYEPLPKFIRKNANLKVTAYQNLAITYYRLGKYKEAEKYANKILQENNAYGANKQEIYTLLGNIYQNIGSYSKSEECYQQGNTIYQNLAKTNSPQYSAYEHLKLLGSYSNLFYAKGQYQKADYYYNNVLENLLKLQQGQSESYANILSSQASMYMDLGRYETSLAKFKEALRIKEDLYGKEHPSYAKTLANFTDLLVSLKQYDKAEPLYQKSLSIKAKHLGKKHPEYAILLNNLAQLYSLMGKYSQARQYFEQSLKLQAKQEAENPIIRAITLRNMAYIYEFEGDYKKALKHFEECLKIREVYLDSTHIDYPDILQSLAVLHSKMQQPEKAEHYYLRANKLYQQILRDLYFYMSEKDRLDFDTRIGHFQDNFAYFAIQRIPENPHLSIDLLESRLNVKALNLENITKIKQSVYASADSSTIRYYEDWQSRREILGKTARMSQSEIDAQNIQIDELKRNINEIEKSLSIYIQKPKAHKWQDLQAKLQAHEALVEIIPIGYSDENPKQKSIYAALILKHKQAYPDFVLIDSTGQLDNKFLKYYQNAIKYKQEDRLSYQHYWAKIAEQLKGIEKVYLSPAGVYHKISLYGLLNPQNNQYLIDELEIKLLNASREMLEQSKQSLEANPSQDMMFFAYPIYDLNETQHRESIRKLREGVQNNKPYLPSAEPLPASQRDLQKAQYQETVNLRLLPGTREEVESITRLLLDNGFSPQKYLGEEALEERVKALRSPRVLHIATHGFFLADIQQKREKERVFGIQRSILEENPLLRSGLLLTGSERLLNSPSFSQEFEDGVLTAYEVSNLQLLGTDLVVLSACETGLGAVQNGEGVYGLQRAFRIAGAKAVIMSLWQVDDMATQQLMELFYQRWIKTQNKREAFIWAKKELRKQFPAPYYWAAFVMVGD